MKKIRIQLAIFWIAHFLTYSFGDILRMLQPGYIAENGATSELLLVASTFGLLQSIIIVLTTILAEKQVRILNLAGAAFFALINFAWLYECYSKQYPAWEYVLILGYFACNILVIWFSYKWPSQDN